MKRYFLCVLLVLGLLFLTAQTQELEQEPQYASGTIKVLSQFGGDLFLDGEFVQSLFAHGTATWTDIPVGMHLVELKNPREQLKYAFMLSENELLTVDFDNLPAPIPASKPLTAEEPETSAQPTLAPIVNSHSFGKGGLIVQSGADGDIYLGGEYLQSIKEDQTRKIKNIPAGEYSLEFFNRYAGIRKDIVLGSGNMESVNISNAELIPYAHDMVFLAGGSFFLGSQFIDRPEHERPRHEVWLSPFLIGCTEVTQSLWQSVMGSNPSVRSAANLPVTNVHWYEVLDFCNKLSLKEGFAPCYKINKHFPDANNVGDFDSLRYSVYFNREANGYRLPTEAEWEYAARSGDSANRLQYSGSNRINDVAWYDGNSEKKLQEVAKKQANAFELYDMSGNVLEWCWDWWGPYNEEEAENPTGATSGTYRVIRGGGWMSQPDLCICTSRGGNSPHASAKDLGFRLVRNARAQMQQ